MCRDLPLTPLGFLDLDQGLLYDGEDHLANIALLHHLVVVDVLYNDGLVFLVIKRAISGDI